MSHPWVQNDSVEVKLAKVKKDVAMIRELQEDNQNLVALNQERKKERAILIKMLITEAEETSRRYKETSKLAENLSHALSEIKGLREENEQLHIIVKRLLEKNGLPDPQQETRIAGWVPIDQVAVREIDIRGLPESTDDSVITPDSEERMATMSPTTCIIGIPYE